MPAVSAAASPFSFLIPEKRRNVDFTASCPCGDLRVQGSGSRVQGSGFRVQGSGFRVQGSGSRVQGSGFRVQGSGFRVQGSGFRVQGSRFRVVSTVLLPAPAVINIHLRINVVTLAQQNLLPECSTITSMARSSSDFRYPKAIIHSCDAREVDEARA